MQTGPVVTGLFGGLLACLSAGQWTDFPSYPSYQGTESVATGSMPKAIKALALVFTLLGDCSYVSYVIMCV